MVRLFYDYPKGSFKLNKGVRVCENLLAEVYKSSSGDILCNKLVARKNKYNFFKTIFWTAAVSFYGVVFPGSSTWEEK